MFPFSSCIFTHHAPGFGTVQVSCYTSSELALRFGLKNFVAIMAAACSFALLLSFCKDFFFWDWILLSCPVWSWTISGGQLGLKLKTFLPLLPQSRGEKSASWTGCLSFFNEQGLLCFPDWPRTGYLTRAGLELMILLPPCSECWNYSHSPPGPPQMYSLSYQEFHVSQEIYPISLF